MKRLSLLGMFILIAMFGFNAKANISGQVVAETFCNQTTQIEVCKGEYIVITDNGSYKVVVFNK